MFYVRAGVPIPDISYLGRWHSNLVFQYAEEALEDRAANEKLTEPRAKFRPRPKKVEEVSSGSVPDPPRDPSSLPPETSTPSSRPQLLGPAEVLTEAPKWVKAHGRSKVIHLVDRLEKPTSASWKTKCGWAFARASHFTLFVSVPAGATRCLKCRLFPRPSAASHFVEDGGVGDWTAGKG